MKTYVVTGRPIGAPFQVLVDHAVGDTFSADLDADTEALLIGCGALRRVRTVTPKAEPKPVEAPKPEPPKEEKPDEPANPEPSGARPAASAGSGHGGARPDRPRAPEPKPEQRQERQARKPHRA